jgi:hypothetical protein
MNTETCKIPGRIKDSIDAYVETGIPLGGFLSAVMENDFMSAASRADSTNAPYLQEIASYVYNNVPSAAFGSPERVKAWRELKSLRAVQSAG